MKRFLLFAFDEYDASGGINDFIKDFDSLLEIKQFLDLQRITRGWWDIMDIVTKTSFEFKDKQKFTDIVNTKYGSYELLKILTLKKFNKDIRKMLYEKCNNNCEYKFTKIENY